MAKCKFCGQGVRVAPVFHPSCWEQAVNKLASEMGIVSFLLNWTMRHWWTNASSVR